MKSLILLAPLALVTCNPDPVLVLPPAELAECEAEPVAPELQAMDWSDMETAREIFRQRGETTLEYILSLRSAGSDCRAKVKGLAAWIEKAGG